MNKKRTRVHVQRTKSEVHKLDSLQQMCKTEFNTNQCVACVFVWVGVFACVLCCVVSQCACVCVCVCV